MGPLAIDCSCIKMLELTMNRDDAWALLTEFTKGESLLKHALAVEAAVRGYARSFGEDEDAWGSPRFCTTSTTSAGRRSGIIRTRAPRSCARKATRSG